MDKKTGAVASMLDALLAISLLHETVESNRGGPICVTCGFVELPCPTMRVVRPVILEEE